MPATPDGGWVLDDSEPVLYSDVCMTCTRYSFVPAADDVRRCDAFPDGIPDVIWRGDLKHIVAYPGDHGLTYKSRG